MPNPSFWRGRRVLLTGHTGFKGSWASLWLSRLGAHTTGFALEANTEPSLTKLIGPNSNVVSLIGDLRDQAAVTNAVLEAQPEVVLHMAAQPLVRRSFRDPVETFETNVMGTVNLLDALRGASGVIAILVVTTDKTYENSEDTRRLVEDDKLGGSDPYSASKACTEILTSAYARSFFAPRGVAVATARAGNVIGGGDWSEDRLVPDIWRALREKRAVELRYPHATRPWQHVLEPLSGYLRYIERLAVGNENNLPRALNFGPVENTALTVAELTEAFYRAHGAGLGWQQAPGSHPPEKNTLAIDSTRAIQSLGWQPRLTPVERIEWTVAWYRAFDDGEDVQKVTVNQIDAYQGRI